MKAEIHLKQQENQALREKLQMNEAGETEYDIKLGVILVRASDELRDATVIDEARKSKNEREIQVLMERLKYMTVVEKIG